jgi:hypothetical protein
LQLEISKSRETKKKEKRERKDDIPPDVPPELKDQLAHLIELQTRLCCAAHSKPGMKVFCYIAPVGKGVEGHRELSHGEMTLWAKYIVSQKLNAKRKEKKAYLDYRSVA